MTREAMPEGSLRRAPNGYTYIKENGKWITYARWKMQKKLGRPLTSSERVSYKNGNIDDNDINNLELKVVKADPRKKLNQLLAKRDAIDAQIEQLRLELNEHVI